MDNLRFPLHYSDDELRIENVKLTDLAARYGTPLYVYSAAAIRHAVDEFKKGGDGANLLFCYAVKANSNLSILKLIGDEGFGADIVSGGELFRALKAGIPAGKIVYSGVGKTDREIEAALDAGILLFSIESEEELETVSAIADKRGKTAPISIRINPDIDAGTHPYIATGLKENKFGIFHDRVVALCEKARSLPGVDPIGIGFHIGSQLTGLSAFREAGEKIAGMVREIEEKGITLRYIDVGGGLGITYRDETPPSRGEYVRALVETINRTDLTLIFEPGRSIVGAAGILLSRILFRKESGEKTFYICDAAMNDLIRPTLYEAHHDILPVRRRATEETERVDLVGPVCETGDFLAKERELPVCRRDDLIAIASAGAYGFVMSSNYNSRPRAAEILVDREQAIEIRRRENYDDLVRLES